MAMIYQGEPTDEEIQARKEWDKDSPDHLAIRPQCLTCGGSNTMWIRQEWCVCFDCESSFVNHYGDIRTEEEKEKDEFWNLFAE